MIENKDERDDVYWGDDGCFLRGREEIFGLVASLLKFPVERESERHFLLAALRRTLSLEKAFLGSVRDSNGQMALTIVRLNLDTLARTYALYWADQTPGLGAEKFASQVMDGKSIRDMKLRSKKTRATDGWLIDQIKALGDWIPGVYKVTSGAIHFSDFHIKQMLQQAKPKSRLEDGAMLVELAIGPTDVDVGPTHYREVRGAFHHITQMLIACVRGRCELSLE